MCSNSAFAAWKRSGASRLGQASTGGPEDSKFAMQNDPRDRRFNFGKKSCEMTLFMGSFWKQKEASSMGAKEPTA
nr:unnamed protein product [Spirometra erinaceieuropaei]